MSKGVNEKVSIVPRQFKTQLPLKEGVIVSFANVELNSGHKQERDAWLELMLRELRHGLASAKGSWKYGEALVGEDRQAAMRLQVKYGAGMINEVIGKKAEGKKIEFPELGWEIKTDAQGEVIDVERELITRAWPYTVRFLRQPQGEEPLGFVDIKIESQVKVNGEVVDNPFEVIDWNKVIEGGEVDLSGVEGIEIVGERYLDEWLEEDVSPDKRREFSRPDVIVGRNWDTFKVSEMARDSRPMMIVELGEIRKDCEDRAGLVMIKFPTHLPIDGLEVDQASERVLERMSPYGGRGKELSRKVIQKEERGSRALPYQSWLENKLKELVGESMVGDVEKLMEGDFFKFEAMRKLAEIMNVREGEGAADVDPELIKMVIETRKDYQTLLGEKGKKSEIRTQFFWTLATMMTLRRATSYVAVPSEGRLTPVTLGLQVIDDLLEAEKLVGENEETSNSYLNTRIVLREIAEIAKERSTTEVLKRLSDLKNEENEAILEGVLEWLVLTTGKIDEVAEYVVKDDEENLNDLGYAQFFAKEAEKIGIQGIDIENWEGEDGILVQVNTVFLKSMQLIEYPEKFLKNQLEAELSKLFQLGEDDSLIFISSEMIKKASKETGLEMNEEEDGFVVDGELNTEEFRKRLLDFRKRLMMEVVGEFRENGARNFIEQLRKENEKEDAAEIRKRVASFTKSVEEAGEVLTEVMKDTRKSLAMSGSTAVISDWLTDIPWLQKITATAKAMIKPEVSTSGLKGKNATGGKGAFHSALSKDAGTCMATTFDGVSIRVSMDNPSMILEVVLPYIQRNEELKKGLTSFMQDSGDYDKKVVEGVMKVLEDDEYDVSSLTDEDKKHLGGYERSRVKASKNYYYRQRMEEEVASFFGVLGDYILSESNKESMDDNVALLVGEKFPRLFEAKMNYWLAKYEENLANLVYIFQLGFDNEGDYLEIREARYRAQQKARLMQEKYVALMNNNFGLGEEDE